MRKHFHKCPHPPHNCHKSSLSANPSPAKNTRQPTLWPQDYRVRQQWKRHSRQKRDSRRQNGSYNRRSSYVWKWSLNWLNLNKLSSDEKAYGPYLSITLCGCLDFLHLRFSSMILQRQAVVSICKWFLWASLSTSAPCTASMVWIRACPLSFGHHPLLKSPPLNSQAKRESRREPPIRSWVGRLSPAQRALSQFAWMRGTPLIFLQILLWCFQARVYDRL